MTLFFVVIEKHAAWDRAHAALHGGPEPSAEDLRQRREASTAPRVRHAVFGGLLVGLAETLDWEWR